MAKVRTLISSPKASHPASISVVALKNSEYELSYVLVDLSNLYLKRSLSKFESLICGPYF